MNTIQLEYFLELARVLNYRQASEQLGITQPTLTKAMQHLEGDLGFPLFFRQGRGICITQQGEAFLPYARECLNVLNQGIHQAFQQQTLRLGCIAALETSLLPEFVQLYQQRKPGVLIQIHNNVSNALQDMLENDQLDLILSAPSDRYSDIVFYELFEQPLAVCLHPTHPLAGREELWPEELTSETFVTHTKSGFFYNLYSSIFTDLNSHIKIAAEADEDSTLLSLVRSKMGICIVALNPTLNTFGLAVIPLRQKKVRRVIALGCKQKRTGELDAASLAIKLKKLQ